MIYFTDDCIIGIDELDEEHRHLFDLIDRGMQLLKNEYLPDRYESVKGLLAELEDYAEQHFAHEEEYMEKIRDPEIIRQRVQHGIFRDRVRTWSFADVSEEHQQQQVLEELMDFMAKWLYRHIIGSDIMIGKLPPLEEWMIRVNPCEFTDEYLVGVRMIDIEHKELFHIVEQAYKLVKSGTEGEMEEVSGILESLSQYALEHFAHEEEYMERIGYEGLPAQRRAHEAFAYRLQNASEIDEGADPQLYMEELIEFLIGWLINHICNQDKKIPSR